MDRDTFLAAERAGLVPLRPNIVYRNTYCGRGVLGENTSADAAGRDARGYLPVERWVVSVSPAENVEPVPGEGLSRVADPDDDARLLADYVFPGDDAPALSGLRWPLLKILDIGGVPVTPDYGDAPELPPIPVHIHSGTVRDGALEGPGKLESYFFPPVEGVDYAGVTTKLGVRPGVTRNEFLAALAEFGRSDTAYGLLNEYPIEDYDIWLIPARTIHAPGPRLTLEIQTPQDDFNLCAWHFGQRVEGADLDEARGDLLLRGFADERALLDEAVDWERSTRPDFETRFKRAPEELDSGDWGRRLRVFFGPFNAEFVELAPGGELALAAADHPLGLLLWTGEASVDGFPLEAGICDEYLVRGGREIRLKNGSAKRPASVLVMHPMGNAR